MVEFYKTWNGEGDFGKWSVDQVGRKLSFLRRPFTWTHLSFVFACVFVFSEMTFHSNLGDLVICLCICLFWDVLWLKLRWSCHLWSFDPTSSSVICRRQMAFGAGALLQTNVQLDKYYNEYWTNIVSELAFRKNIVFELVIRTNFVSELALRIKMVSFSIGYLTFFSSELISSTILRLKLQPRKMNDSGLCVHGNLQNCFMWAFLFLIIPEDIFVMRIINIYAIWAVQYICSQERRTHCPWFIV